MEKSYSKILSITPAGKSKVYDFTVKHIHRILANNFYTSNCHVDHPDVRSFVTMKDDRTKITGANISVKITDEFMKAVEFDSDYYLRWPINKTIDTSKVLQYNKLYKREDGTHVVRIKARDLWNTIIKQAHKNAEPGVIFWDRVIQESPADCYSGDGMVTTGTNPCGEVPLSPFDSCRLGSINLNNMVTNPYTDRADINWKLLSRVSRLSQRFMDDIITLEEEKILAIINKIKNDPEKQEYKQVEFDLWNKILTVLRKGRRTGLGVLGLGDMLAKLGVKYGTPESTKLKEKIIKYIAINSYKESVIMAKERGAFPLWNADTEAHNPFIRRIVSDNFSEKEYSDYLKYGRRNIANMAIAPTGSLAILCQTTSGIEPVFKITYKRKRKVNPNDQNQARPVTIDDTGDAWEEYPVFHHEFVKWFTVNHPDIESPETHLEKLTDKEIDDLVQVSPWEGSESHDIDPIEKVKSQGAIQRWVDHSISVTHNLPEKSTLDEVSRIYFEAWKAGCKGCTIYREGSRDGVLITKKKKDKFIEHHAPKRPKELSADYYMATVKGQRYGVIVGLLNDRPYEIFAFANPEIRETCRGKITKIRKGFYEFESDKGKISGLHLATEALEERAHTIWVSMLLRHGAPIEHIVNVAKKVDDNITSFSSVVRRTLSRYIKLEGEEDKCPACDTGKLIREEGCMHCDTCEYSKCG